MGEACFGPLDLYINILAFGVDTVDAGRTYVYSTLPAKYEQNVWVDVVGAFFKG